MRKELRRWLRDFHDEVYIPSVFVTHDQEEALEISDEVVIRHVNTAGPIARLLVKRPETKEIVEVEVGRSEKRELDIKTGDRVFVCVDSSRVCLE